MTPSSIMARRKDFQLGANLPSLQQLHRESSQRQAESKSSIESILISTRKRRMIEHGSSLDDCLRSLPLLEDNSEVFTSTSYGTGCDTSLSTLLNVTRAGTPTSMALGVSH